MEEITKGKNSDRSRQIKDKLHAERVLRKCVEKRGTDR